MVDWKLNPYVKAVWKWLWLILVVTIIAAGSGFGVSRMMKTMYRGIATVMTGESNASPQLSTENWVLSQRLAAGYAAQATRQPILQAAVNSLHLNVDWREVQQNVLIQPIVNTSMLEIRVTDSDPQRSAALANEIARQMMAQSSSVSDEQDLQQRRAFAQQQLDQLQNSIQTTQNAIAQRQTALETQASARAVMDLQDQIKADQAKVTDWQAQYTKLLSSFPQKSPSTLSLVEAAVPLTTPVSPNILFNVLLAALLGVLLSVGAILLIEHVRASKVRSPAELVETVPEALVLGSLTYVGKREMQETGGLLATERTDSGIAEAFRVIRTNIRFAATGGEPLVLLVTSPNLGEGKSTISVNVAASFAQLGKRTILVDADMRHPTAHSLLGLSHNEGLADLLLGKMEWLTDLASELVVETRVPNLTFLPAGTAGTANPGELLASPSMGRLFEVLRGSAEVVVLDAPPVLPVADAAILASLPVGVVLVAEAEQTSIKSLALAHEALVNAHARILGCILNKSVARKDAYYSYYSGSSDNASAERQRPARKLLPLSRRQ